MNHIPPLPFLTLPAISAILVSPLAWCQGTQSPPNLVRNSSFEEVVEGRQANWRIGGQVSAFTTERAHTGKISLKVDDQSSSDGSNVSSDLTPVKPGVKYTISVWGWTVTGKGLGVYVNCYTADRKRIPSGPAQYHKMASPRRKRWRKTSFVMTTPANCAFLQVWLHSYSGAVVTGYIDDVSVQEGALVKHEAAPSQKPYEATPVKLYEGEHPFLLLTAPEAAEIKAKAAKHKWARDTLRWFLLAAEGWTKKPLSFPDRGGGWYHWYACPKDGHGLSTLSPTQHKCRKCGKLFTGEPYDSVALMGVHNELARRARDLGLAHLLTGDARHAERVKEILLGYAQRYNTYALHDVHGLNDKRRSAARVGPQTLDESCWLIPVAQAYDLIFPSGVLSDADKQTIENDLLRAAANIIARNQVGRSNWQSWHNAAIGAVAFCLKDRELAERVVNGPHGFRFQMANSVTDDGLWYEGSWGYHWYALSAHVHLSEIAFRSGVDLYADPRYKSMFDASLRFMAPNRELPAFHDSQVCSALGRPVFYEVAFRRWGDANYAWVIGQRKRGKDALWFGAGEVPKVEVPDLGSCDFPAAGWVVLRSGTALDSMYFAMDYGPHGGGHGHPDKLGFSLYALGDFVAHDPGCVSYGLPIHGQWYKQTVSHNTIVVDGLSQEECTGELVLFCSSPSFRAGCARADDAYAPARMSRLVAMTDDFLILVDDVADREPHTWDWVYHGIGELTVDLPLDPQDDPLGAEDGYQHIAEVRRGTTDAAWSATWRTKDRSVRLTMLSAPKTEVISGVGWSLRSVGRQPMLVARRQETARTRYVALFEPYRSAPEIGLFEGVEASGPDGAAAFRVERAGVSTILLCGEPGRETRTEPARGDGRLMVAATGAAPYAYLVDGAVLDSQALRLQCDRQTRAYVRREGDGLYFIEHQGAAAARITLAGALLAADRKALGKPQLHRLNQSLDRTGEIVFEPSDAGLTAVFGPGECAELAFPMAQSLKQVRAAQARAAAEAERLARLPPIPEFPVVAFTRPADVAAVPGARITIEAADFSAEGRGKVDKTTSKVGAQGAAFLKWDAPGHWLEWKFQVPAAADYHLTYRYCTANEGSTRAIVIDGKYPGKFWKRCAFPCTGGYSNQTDDWRSLTLADPRTKQPLRIHLPAGEHAIRMYNYNGPVNLDTITLEPAP